jgi:hypothetical protein
MMEMDQEEVRGGIFVEEAKRLMREDEEENF